MSRAINADGQVGVIAKGPGYFSISVINVRNISIQIKGSEAAAFSHGLVGYARDYRRIVHRRHRKGGSVTIE
jgi:hypothetical protein